MGVSKISFEHGVEHGVMLAYWMVVCSILVGSTPPSREHGGIVMGTNITECDNGQININRDLPADYTRSHVCGSDEEVIHEQKTQIMLSCMDNQDIPLPLHLCMNTSISYTDDPPRGGPHRPHWPVYGEYEYIPPQRWVHSMEHGGLVFLYHPCADPELVNKVRQVVKNCIRRHIITPYRNLPPHRPLALVTYGCKLTFSEVNVNILQTFIKGYAINKNRASEWQVSRDGDYTFGLVEKAQVVDGSDFQDSNLCPQMY